jgi:putative SOS response-associated peptidase YedK
MWTDNETSEFIHTFSIITTTPNKTVRKIHNSKKRMPTILREEDYNFWLDESVKADYFDQNIFTAYPENDMQAWQTTKQLDYKQNDEALIQPVESEVQLDNSFQNDLFAE